MKDEYTVHEIKAPSLALLFPIAALANFTSVFYTPALPSITEYFHISPGYAESSMYLYLLFVAIGCLIYGPISNRFGRKPALYVGFSIVILGSILCIASGLVRSFIIFDIGRALQALGGAAGLQVGFTMIGDCYKPPKSMKITSYVSLAFAVSPSIGIAIGGLLTNSFGWQGCFYFILIYLVVLLTLVIYCVPETLPIKHTDSFKIGKIINGYCAKFKKIRVLLTGLIVGSVVSLTYLFFSIAPFIGISFLKLSPRVYGFYSLVPSAFLVVGCLLTAFLTKHLKPFTTIKIGAGVLILGALTLLLLFLGGYVNVITLFLPVSFGLIGQAFVQINALGLVLHHSVNKALTSSVVMFINTMISTVAVWVLNFNNEENVLVLPIIFLALALLTSLLYYGLSKTYTFLD